MAPYHCLPLVLFHTEIPLKFLPTGELKSLPSRIARIMVQPQPVAFYSNLCALFVSGLNQLVIFLNFSLTCNRIGSHAA